MLCVTFMLLKLLLRRFGVGGIPVVAGGAVFRVGRVVQARKWGGGGKLLEDAQAIGEVIGLLVGQ